LVQEEEGDRVAVTIAIAGPPCAGKSTIAAEAARRLGVPHLSMDATRQRILPGAAHTRADRQVAYRAMLMAAELLHRVGSSVILDAPYGHEENRIALGALSPVWVECRVSPEEAVRRLRQRGFDPERPDLSEDVVRRSAEEYRYTAELVLDTEAMGVDECVAEVVRLATSQ
jgi:predicted kinase